MPSAFLLARRGKKYNRCERIFYLPAGRGQYCMVYQVPLSRPCRVHAVAREHLLRAKTRPLSEGSG